MKKQIIMLFAFLLVTAASFAEENDRRREDEWNVIPLFQYNYLSLDSQVIHSPGAGLVVKSEEVLFVGVYSRHSIEEPLNYEYPDVYHTIDMLLDGKKKRHQYIGIFKSESNRPVSGGLHTFQAAMVYGYEIVSSGNASFVLGGGIAVSDFGIEFSNGSNCPVIPVPLVRAKYSSQWIAADFDFLTTPNLNVVIGPESHFRIIGDFRMEQFRDGRDVLFEVALAYRFFSAAHPMGDFAGISLGIRNDNYGAFNLSDDIGEEESLEIHYYALFGRIDLTLLKITAGYAVGGRELYREEDTRDLGDGYFISVEGLYQF
ncbi:MAG TPA: hypothetical protein PK253_06100 [Spirochaetota bacterium]|nr:hypothetical protein [Spirochaetota bacterium]